MSAHKSIRLGEIGNTESPFVDIYVRFIPFLLKPSPDSKADSPEKKTELCSLNIFVKPLHLSIFGRAERAAVAAP